MDMEERRAESDRIAEEAMAEAVRSIFRRRFGSEPDHLLPNYFGPLTPDSSETRPAPAPPSEDKDFLSTRFYKGKEDDGEEKDDCCICLERLRRGLVATLHCRHEFHGCCIGRWLSHGKNFCPLCKATAINKLCSSIA